MRNCNMQNSNMQNCNMPGCAMPEPRMPESRMSEPHMSESRMSEPRMSESRMSEPRMSESRMSESRMANKMGYFMRDNDSSYRCDDYPVGMAYVPWQTFKDIYDMERGFEAGTIFSELEKPFMGRRAFRR